MNLLIVGAGMYVTGRHGSGIGTVLTSAMQTLGNDKQNTIIICATDPANNVVVEEAVRRINHELGLITTVQYIAYDGTITSLAKLAQDHAINVAIVSTPDHLHFMQVSTLLKMGIHTLCVKPLVPTLKQHETLVELAELHNVLGVIEFHKRWDESNLLAKRYIGDGMLGRIHNISVDYSQQIAIPTETFSSWVEHTNIFQYLGIHYVDLVFWLTGAAPVRLCCRGTRGALEAKGINTWDSVHVWLIARQLNGDEFLVQFNLSWIDSNLSPALSDQRFSVLGTNGRLDLDQRNRGVAVTLLGQPLQYLNPWFSELLPTPEGTLEMQGYGFKSIFHFIYNTQQLISGSASTENFTSRCPTFKDCILSTYVIDLVTQCLQEGTHGFVEF